MTFRESIRQRGRRAVPFHEHDGSDISGEIVASVIKVIQLLGGTITGEEIIIAGGVDGIIRSDNFVAGSAGWRQRGDGTFEAQDGIFRGTLNADDLTAGILAVARIAAGTITVNELIIGSFDNLVQDPGAESGNSVANSIHDFNAAGGIWVVTNSTTISRSGAHLWVYQPSGQTSPAILAFNGAVTIPSFHQAATEGDQFLFLFRAMRALVATTNRVHAQLSWRDETGTELSSIDGTITTLTDTFQDVSVEGVAPVGTTYVVFRVVVLNDGNDVFIRFDDAYSRRKIATLIIEDQAVDIDRMLDPVYVEAQNGTASNVSLSTTEADMASVTMTIPSWVGTAYTVSTATIQMSASAAHDLVLRIKSGGTSFSSRQATATSGEILAMSTSHTRTIVVPGATLVVKSTGDLTSGTNSSNASIIAAYLTGIR